MTELSRENVEQVLSEFIDPHLESSLVAAKAVTDIQVEGTAVSISLAMPYPCAGYVDTLKQELTADLGCRIGQGWCWQIDDFCKFGIGIVG